MMDYEKSKADALQETARLTERQKQIVQEKTRLDAELMSIQRQLIGLEQIIDGLDVATLQTPPDEEPVGFTDHIRSLLQNTSIHLLPTQIRDSCLNAGFKGSSLKNLLISVHNVLHRVHEHLDEKQIDGKTAYKWKGTISQTTIRKWRRHGGPSSPISGDAVNAALVSLGLAPLSIDPKPKNPQLQWNAKLQDQITAERERINKKPKGD